MNMSKLVGMLLFVWVFAVMCLIFWAMDQGFAGVSPLQAFRIRLGTIAGAILSILVLYGNAMMTW